MRLAELYTEKFCASASLSSVHSPGTHKMREPKKKKKTPQTRAFVSHVHSVVTQISPEGLPDPVDKNPILMSQNAFLIYEETLARQTMRFRFEHRAELLLYN